MTAISFWLYIFCFTLLSSLVRAQAFSWDCANTPNGCNNACFSVFCAGRPGLLTRNAPGVARTNNRRRSGCANAPCTFVPWAMPGTVCDEFPFASAVEGGAGAAQRCIPTVESTTQGLLLANYINGARIAVGGTYQVFLQNVNLVASSYCSRLSCLGDGQEFRTLQLRYPRGQETMVLPKLVNDTTSGLYPVADKARTFIAQGNIKLTLLSTDKNTDFIGTTVWIADGKEVQIQAEITKDSDLA
ncbi:deoxyribonuclease NucA/NucB-domain-containing protein [Xylogone sp. PMI_703]|nr:deoxyribonuclease NucA/NucB-domain-containing protein [Xylogone sp. PMI_703]